MVQGGAGWCNESGVTRVVVQGGAGWCWVV